MADQSKTDALRAMREANWAKRNKSSGLRISSRLKGKTASGDGVALKSMAHPPGLIDAMAEAIKSGKLSLKPGRPRLGEKRDKPWLDTKPPMSKSTWYRRKAEKT